MAKTFYATVRIDFNKEMDSEEVQDLLASSMTITDNQEIVEGLTLCGLNEE